MSSGTHTVELPLPIEKVWDFVSDMNNWAPLVPGYIEHEILSEEQSTWTFKGDLGIMQKTVTLQVDITEWTKPSCITFDLKGLNENFAGDGYFKAETTSDSTTNIQGNLTINAKGMMGPMINTILKSFVPKTAEQLTDAVAQEIIDTHLKTIE